MGPERVASRRPSYAGSNHRNGTARLSPRVRYRIFAVFIFKALRLSSVLLVLATSAIAADKSTPPRDQSAVEEFVSAFISAFNNLDWEKFRHCFADDATVFHPAIFPHRLDGRDNYEPAWRRVFGEIRSSSGKSQPPFMDLKPENLKVQMLGSVAVVTFHLDRGRGSVGRRTLVLHKTSGGWKIIHLHASNAEFQQPTN